MAALASVCGDRLGHSFLFWLMAVISFDNNAAVNTQCFAEIRFLTFWYNNTLKMLTTYK